MGTPIITVDIYCRVSGRMQENNTSLAFQEEKCREAAELQGFRVGEVFKEVASGYTLDRKKLKELQERYRRGVIQGVFIWKVSRLARSQEYINYLMVEMKVHGCIVCCVHTPLNEKDDDYQLRLFMETFFADRERTEIVTKLADAKVASVRNGNYAICGNQPRYGYQWLYIKDVQGVLRKVGYKLDETQSAHVREMFDLFEQGMSLNSLNSYMKSVDPSSRKWDARNIKLMLMDRRYTGKNASIFFSEKTGVIHFAEIPLPDGTYPQIISDEQFAQVQERIGHYDKPSRNLAPKSFLLRKLAVCGVCGRRLTCSNHVKDPTGRRAQNYVCRKEPGHALSISARILDKEVWAFFEGIAHDLPLIKGAIEQVLRNTSLTEEYQKIAQQRAEHQAIITRLEEDLLYGRVTDDTRPFVYRQMGIQQKALALLDQREADQGVLLREMGEKKKKYENILGWYSRMNLAVQGENEPLTYEDKREFLMVVLGVKVRVSPPQELRGKRWHVELDGPSDECLPV